MIGQAKAVVGALGVGLALYIVGSVIVLVVDSNEINHLYKEYMGIIWFVLSVVSYPFVRRLLRDEGK